MQKKPILKKILFIYWLIRMHSFTFDKMVLVPPESLNSRAKIGVAFVTKCGISLSEVNRLNDLFWATESSIGPSDIYFVQICPWEIVSIFPNFFLFEIKKNHQNHLQFLVTCSSPFEYVLNWGASYWIARNIFMNEKQENYTVSILSIFIDVRFKQPQIATSPWKYITSVIFAVAHDEQKKKKKQISFWSWKHREFDISFWFNLIANVCIYVFCAQRTLGILTLKIWISQNIFRFCSQKEEKMK